MQNRLRILRAEHNWSQADLAERLGVSRQTVNALEVGKSDPSLLLAFKVAQVLRCPIETIFFSKEKSMPMFERFTQKAINVIPLAQEEAGRLGHQYVGTEQLLVGLIAEGSGIAAGALKSVGVMLDSAQDEVEKIIGHGSGIKGWEFPFTPRGKLALNNAIAESQKLGHNYVGTEHLLLGLLQVTDGVGVQILQNLGVDLKHLRQRVLREIEIMLEAGTPTPEVTSSPNRINSSGDNSGGSPTDFTSGEISARFCALLFSWVEPRQLGHIVGASAGFQLPNGDVATPIISFFSRSRLKRVPRTYPELVPDLVVEIKSAFDKLASVQERIQRFLDLGAKIGLLINPDERTVTVYSSSTKLVVLEESDKLTIPELLPEWELAVSQLWPPVFK